MAIVLKAPPSSGAPIRGSDQALTDPGAPESFEPPTRMRENFLAEPTRFGAMVGRSAAMRETFSILQRAAASEVTILLEGETGTGKEASAESIHRESPRRDGPFVVVDCGAIAENLLESELFGHEKGSFTGAVAGRDGAFLAAHGGTIFLDEIGELSIDLQPKILRVLERRHVKRVGSNVYQDIDIRLIAATNRSLRAEVAGGRFRSDLYYRLAVVQIKLPPLRERLADMPMLVDHVLANLGVLGTSDAIALRTPEFLSNLQKYRWPGNIRQLRNHIERCIALGDPHLSPAMDTTPPEPGGGGEGDATIDVSQPLRIARDAWVATFERRYLDTLLIRHGNNVSAAARAAGVDRIHFYRLLWKHGLRAHEPTSAGGKR